MHVRVFAGGGRSGRCDDWLGGQTTHSAAQRGTLTYLFTASCWHLLVLNWPTLLPSPSVIVGMDPTRHAHTRMSWTNNHDDRITLGRNHAPQTRPRFFVRKPLVAWSPRQRLPCMPKHWLFFKPTPWVTTVVQTHHLPRMHCSHIYRWWVCSSVRWLFWVLWRCNTNVAGINLNLTLSHTLCHNYRTLFTSIRLCARSKRTV